MPLVTDQKNPIYRFLASERHRLLAGDRDGDIRDGAEAADVCDTGPVESGGCVKQSGRDGDALAGGRQTWRPSDTAAIGFHPHDDLGAAILPNFLQHILDPCLGGTGHESGRDDGGGENE